MNEVYSPVSTAPGMRYFPVWVLAFDAWCLFAWGWGAASVHGFEGSCVACEILTYESKLLLELIIVNLLGTWLMVQQKPWQKALFLLLFTLYFFTFSLQVIGVAVLGQSADLMLLQDGRLQQGLVQNWVFLLGSLLVYALLVILYWHASVSMKGAWRTTILFLACGMVTYAWGRTSAFNGYWKELETRGLTLSYPVKKGVSLTSRHLRKVSEYSGQDLFERLFGVDGEGSHSGKAMVFRLPDIDLLPVWSVDTRINRTACNLRQIAPAKGWVIKQWKNQDSLCNDQSLQPTPDCPGAAAELSTSTARYCHWKNKRRVLLSMNAAKMANHGCNPNAKGNVGGFVSYLAWEPKILEDFWKKSERYMVRNMEEVLVRFRFRNMEVDDAYECDRSMLDKKAVHARAIVHSYATATFSEIEPGTPRGTGRSIFYQILNYDARSKVQKHIRKGQHVYLTCNYRNNKYSTMIYRDTVWEFGQPIAYPPREGGGDFVDYEFNLLAGMKRGIKECYGDIDPGNFKFTGFHIGTEIKNGAYHEFMIEKPEIEIIYNRDPG